MRHIGSLPENVKHLQHDMQRNVKNPFKMWNPPPVPAFALVRGGG